MAKNNSNKLPKIEKPKLEGNSHKYKYIGTMPVNVSILGRVVKPGETFDTDATIDNPLFEYVK